MLAFACVSMSVRPFKGIYLILQDKIKRHLAESFPREAEYALKDPIMFGDYRNMLEEAEPRYYEDLLDFDATKALFQEVSSLVTCFCDCYPVGATVRLRRELSSLVPTPENGP